MSSSGRIREGYIEEIEAELDLCKWHLGWQGRRAYVGRNL